MKATTIIIAAALALSVNILFANNDLPSAPVANANTTISLTSLAPAVPTEADFEDAVAMVDFSVLAPVTPSTADVDESEDFSSLAPVVPSEADFE